jgi:hypothetical protein
MSEVSRFVAETVAAELTRLRTRAEAAEAERDAMRAVVETALDEANEHREHEAYRLIAVRRLLSTLQGEK